MMSSKNDESTGLAMGIGLVAAGVMFMAVVVFFLLALFTAVLSVVALIACWRPLRIGKITIEPREARFFLLRGIMGWFLFPVAVVYIAPLFNIPIYQDYIIYLMMSGYMIGSVGIECIIEKIREANEATDAEQVSRLPVVHSRPVQPPQKPFEYARWDDEEER
jgi:hypothetical protein